MFIRVYLHMLEQLHIIIIIIIIDAVVFVVTYSYLICIDLTRVTTTAYNCAYRVCVCVLGRCIHMQEVSFHQCYVRLQMCVSFISEMFIHSLVQHQ